MSKINQIQNALKELDGGKFQKLCDCYFKKKGYNIKPIGSIFGSDKVRKGTPDTIIENENGKLIFIEYTTQINKLFNKLSSDIEKCLNEEKTGVKVSDIEKIILCYTGNLTYKQKQELNQKSDRILLDFYDIGKLSLDIYCEFPGLAKDFLEINIDTGQILTPDDFVLKSDNNKHSTPLSTEFYFREDEIRDALSLLDSNNFLLLSGPAGVGKSRMALEVIHQFEQKNPEYKIFCIIDQGKDLFEDLKIYFSIPGNFLIFVDDANRISKFSYIIQTLQDCKEDQHIKVISTVRDYAIEKIRNSTKPLGTIPEIPLQSFKEEQLIELIKNIYAISNNLWLDRIFKISSGNPRLAIMAAKIALKGEDLNKIIDASLLYEQYFSSIQDDLQELKDSNILKVSGIISLFGSVDKKNENLMEKICTVFDIDQNEFWKLARRLHEFELVDIYENEVVKISDQILATYLFYLCVFNRRIIEFKIIFENFFPAQIDRIKDAIYPCIDIFDYAQIINQIKPVILEKWLACDENNMKDDLHKLIKIFWFLLETEVLTYLNEEVQSIEVDIVNLNTIIWETSNTFAEPNSLLTFLSYFSQTNVPHFFKIALEIICKYVEKKPSTIPNVLRCLSEHFGFNRHSHLQDYNRQHILIDVLIEHSKNGENILFSRLFIALCKNLLHTRFSVTKLNKLEMTTYQFNLISSSSLLGLREKMWNHLFKIFNKKELELYITNLFIHYCGSGYYINIKEIAEFDSKKIIPFLSSKLDPENFQHCLIVHQYINFSDRRNLNVDMKSLSKHFNSNTYQIYKLLSLDYYNLEEKMSSTEFEEFKRKKMNKYTSQYDFEDYKSLLLIGQDIYLKMKQDKNHIQIVSGLLSIFSTLAYRNLDLYVDVIEYYLISNDPFEFPNLIFLIKKLIEAIGVESAKELIEKHSFPTKLHWLFTFYRVLEIEQIKLEYIAHLYSLYEEAELKDIPYDFDYLIRYLDKDNLVITKITKILLNKSSANHFFGHSFRPFFESDTMVNKQLMNLFKNNEDILKQAYLAYDRVNQLADYKGKVLNLITNSDSSFLLEYIDHVYLHNRNFNRYEDSRDYSFLWKRSDAEEIMTLILDKILSYGFDKRLILESYLERLFCISEKNLNSQDIKEKQDEFIKMIIDKHAYRMDMMSLIFSTVSYFDINRRSKLVLYFLNLNKDIENFKSLPLEPKIQGGWLADYIVNTENRISYWNAILDQCSLANLLPHRKYIERKIWDLQKNLEEKKKSDFIDD